MSIVSSLRFHYRRWKKLHTAERLLPRPTPLERTEIDGVHRAFSALTIAPTTGVPRNEADWNSAMNRLRELGASADPRAFQRWDVIIDRMAHVDSPATPIELAALQADDQWLTRWRDAIREVASGLPIPYPGYPDSSEVLVQTAYHVSRLEHLSGRRVSDWDVIVEFGGGFGGLCRLMHMLGFRGRYLIYDLEPFTMLQRYYLRGSNLYDTQRIVLTSSIDTLRQFVNAIGPNEKASFWATWSLSETPLSLRTQITPIVQRVGTHCLAFQGHYGQVDNLAYFSHSWPSVERTIERIAHRPDDYYMVGVTG